ncbi:Phosphatidylserine decarboxylase proenzyme [Candidatus Xenohaliotis californiensis]|uniref:Phosphatidylserine decarboxylase proenzyme n=1 Tax=Candidatus Xenohaliotis californiensis TaxID=84677 RepID=A0ABM9N6Z1_9RICK|nr:Phosphatidylserine decarboxylase proenzyme [Candidatus Xenohaliotis californiensis]
MKCNKDSILLIPPISKEGYPIILVAGLISLFFGIFSLAVGIFGFMITLFLLFFFRDPPRMVPDDDRLVLSPADGLVIDVEEIDGFPPELSLDPVKMTKISVFLSIFDVHVNRIPVAGIIKTLVYIPGVFSNAFFSKSSGKNERQIILIENGKKEEFAVVQIAGLAARRVICKLGDGQVVERGSRFGIIKFGSRVELYIPQSYTLQVVRGQSVVAGETVLATSDGIGLPSCDFNYI